MDDLRPRLSSPTRYVLLFLYGVVWGLVVGALTGAMTATFVIPVFGTIYGFMIGFVAGFVIGVPTSFAVTVVAIVRWGDRPDPRQVRRDLLVIFKVVVALLNG